ncbi:MAG: efflux RND transporter periplasmic adaptor subunit [Rhodospirillaceae bacterium]|nr:efflux RND transporter periplasmic adaptor subunit [Rhodospirillales bacterium]
MQNSRLAIAAVILAALGGGWYVISHKAPPPAATAEVRPQPVVTRAVEAKPMPVRIGAVGNVQSLSMVPVRPRVEGEIVKVHFTEGQEVREGAPLFTLDYRSAEAARRSAEASLARDKAQLERAKRDLERYSILLQSGSATRQKVEQLTSDVGVYEAAIKADNAVIDNAKLALDYAFIKAPVTGRTGAINAKLGSLAKPGDSQPMVTITQLRPITVAFAVAENHLPRIRAAMAAGPLEVTVGSASDPELNAIGQLTFVDSSIDITTATIALKATFPNDDTRLWPGQYVNVALTLGTEAQALTVPAEAVQTGQTGQYVFVVTPDNAADIRPVTVDRILDGVAVIRSGLNAGEKVVIEGQMRLAPGAKVVEKAPLPSKPAAKS